jgi:hypothetical protein
MSRQLPRAAMIRFEADISASGDGSAELSSRAAFKNRASH